MSVKNVKIVYENEFVRFLVENYLINGRKYSFGVVEEPDFVVIICKYKDKYVLINQFRHIWDENSIEFPSGFINKNETPEQAAIREIREETGFHTMSLQIKGTTRISARIRNTGFIFEAYVDEKGDPNFDETENIRIELVSKQELFDIFGKNKIIHGPTLVAFNYLNHRHFDLNSL